VSTSEGTPRKLNGAEDWRWQKRVGGSRCTRQVLAGTRDEMQQQAGPGISLVVRRSRNDAGSNAAQKVIHGGTSQAIGDRPSACTQSRCVARRHVRCGACSERTLLHPPIHPSRAGHPAVGAHPSPPLPAAPRPSCLAVKDGSASLLVMAAPGHRSTPPRRHRASALMLSGTKMKCHRLARQHSHAALPSPTLGSHGRT
jgi:hypothetical protein